MLLFKSTVMTTTSLMRVKPTSMSEQMSAAPLAEMGEGIKTGASGTEECLDEGIARESGVGLAGSVKDGLVNAAPTERTKRSLRLNRWFLPPSLLANMILLILLVRDGRILVDDRVVNAQANREIEAFLDLKLFRNEGGYTLSLNRTYSSEYEYCEIECSIIIQESVVSGLWRCTKRITLGDLRHTGTYWIIRGAFRMATRQDHISGRQTGRDVAKQRRGHVSRQGHVLDTSSTCSSRVIGVFQCA